MDLYELIWDLRQQEQIGQHDKQISQHDAQLSEAKSELQKAAIEIRELQYRVANLASTCQVLCDYLVQNIGIPQEELKQAILNAVSAHSLKVFGICPSCGRSARPGKSWCIYCGFKISNTTESPSSAP